jgi:RNA polymerase sigma-70 factor (ECF subfamily)
MLAYRTGRQEPTTSSVVSSAWFALAAARDPANDGALAHADRVAVFYGRHRAAVHARCRRLLRSDAAAEDATQETFVRVLRHAHHLPPDAEALPWLYRIATNYCLNELRHLRITAAAEEMEDEPLRASPSSPEDQVADRQMVRKVLAPVPSKLRHVAVLRHVDGLLDSEIASALGVSRRTVVYRLLAFRQRAAAGALRVGAAPA